MYFTLIALYVWPSRSLELHPHHDTGATKYFFKQHSKNKVYKETWGSQTPDECKYTFLCAHESVLQWHSELF